MKKKKYSLLRNLYLLMSGYTTKTSLTIYKCTENICTYSEILTFKAYNFRSPITHQLRAFRTDYNKALRKKMKGTKKL